MPKNAQHVDYNDDGTKKYALVLRQGKGGPRNYDLRVFTDDVGGSELVENVPEGTEPGTWSEPK